MTLQVPVILVHRLEVKVADVTLDTGVELDVGMHGCTMCFQRLPAPVDCVTDVTVGKFHTALRL
jgi:hypothetical protein